MTLELGGSDPMIICDDADLAKAASAAAMGRFYNCGQACLAIKRVYVFESVADEVIEAIAAKAERLRVGLGTDEGVQLGPLHSERQRAIMEDQIARTLAGGGEVVAGGGRPDDPRSPTAGSTSRPSSSTRRTTRRWRTEEVFGPALPIWRVRTSTRRSSCANDSPFGLGSSVWTRDLDRAERAAAEHRRRLHVDQLADEGLRRAAVRRRRSASGYGKEHGSEAFDYYTDQKSVVVKRAT